MGRKADFVYEVRRSTSVILEEIENLRGLAKEYQQAGYGISGSPQEITAGDLQGVTDATDLGDILAVIGTTLPAIDAVLDAGHGTNMQKIRLTL
jgi:hypothetical protein